MASVVKIQRGITIFGASADSATATITAVGGLTKAFARITNIQKVALDPDAGSSSDRNDDDIGCTCLLTSTTQITFTRETTGDNEDVAVWWEVWEYTGTAAGRDEFIVRVQENLVMGVGATSANGTLFTSSDQADCCAIVTGLSCSRTTEDFIHLGARATITGSGASTRAVVNRNGNLGSCTVSVVVVEWTGIDWQVERKQIGYSSAGSDTSVTITDVLNWATAAIIDCGLTSTVDGNDEIGDTVRPGSNTTTMLGRLRSGHSSAGSTDHNVMIVRNAKLAVQHYDSVTGGGTDFSGGGAAPQTVDQTITTVVAMDTTAVQGYADNDTTTKEYPSAMWGFRLKDTSTVQWKRTRTVGGGDWSLQVIDFSGVDGSILFNKNVTAAATAAPAITKTFASGTVTARVTRAVGEFACKPGRPVVAPLALPGTVPPLIPANWAGSCVLSSRWQSDVTRTAGLSEDRRALADRPTRTMKVQLTGMDQGDLLKLFMLQQRHLSQRSPVPLYCDHSKVTQASSGTTLFCDTTFRRFYPGGRIIAHEWSTRHKPTNVQFAIVKQVLDDRLVLTASLSGTIAAGGRVYPAIDAEIALGAAQEAVSDSLCDVDAVFAEVSGPSALPASWQGNPPGVQYYSGKPIFDVPPNWGARLTLALQRAGRSYEQGRGVVVEVEGSRPQFEHLLTMTSLTRARAWQVLQFFDAVKGRVRPFWLVAPQRMFQPTAIATTHVDVTAAGNYADVNTYLDYVAIVKRDGTVYVRGIQSTTDNGATWRITFDTVIPSTILADVRKATGAFLVRMKRDDLEERWVTDRACEMTVEVVELLGEQSYSVTNVTDSPTVDSVDAIPNLRLWVDASKNLWHDNAFVGTPDRDVPCEPFPAVECVVHVWDDVRRPSPPLSGGAKSPFLETNSSGRKLIAYANGDLNGGRRAIDHAALSNYWSLAPNSIAPWTDDGYTYFFCCRTPPNSGSSNIFAYAAVPSGGGKMFEWNDGGTVQIFMQAGVTDASLHITGLPQFCDGRVRIGCFTWKPGVYSRVYYDGVLQGSAPTPAGNFPSNALYDARFMQVAGDTTTIADAGIGVNDKFATNALLVFGRALTASELNSVGNLLARLYGANWATVV